MHSEAARLPLDGVAWMERGGKGRKGSLGRVGGSLSRSLSCSVALSKSPVQTGAKTCSVGCPKIMK